MLGRVIHDAYPTAQGLLNADAVTRRRWLRMAVALPTALAQLPSATAAVAVGAVGPAQRTIVFPADHGAHPESRIEWWYLTGTVQEGPQASSSGGNVSAADDEGICGFQLTFFRSRTEVAAGHPSRFAARELVFAHAALTDLKRGKLLHDQRIARSGFGIAGAAVGDTAVSLRDWRLTRVSLQGASHYRALISSNAFAFDFSATPTQPLLLQGVGGYSQKGPQAAQASHYYSQPQLAIGGTLTRDGVARAVHGRAWLDHEWSDSLLPTGAVGWDWIGMNLDDGSALTAFRLRSAEGGTVYAGGSFRAVGASARSFAADEVRFVPGRLWVSPSSRGRYPVEWVVTTPTGQYLVKTLLDAQELDSRSSTGAVYWEGLSELQDEHGQRIGRGYLEMTGYVSPLKL